MVPELDGAAVTRVGAGAVVGRNHEIQALEAALDSLQSGQGRAIALVGEPGVGKSTLMLALTARARAAGIPVLATHGREADPLCSPSSLPTGGREVQGHGCGESADAAAVATVDDLHHLAVDHIPAVQRLIRAATTAPTLLLLAYRERQLPPALTAALAHAASAGLLDVCRLGPLSLEEARLLLGDRPDLDHIHRAGMGNPQYLKALTAQGPANADADAAILGELAELDPTTHSALQAAAVLGEPFHPELLAELADLEVAETMSALDVLARLDLVRPTPLASHYALRHPVVADVVYRRLEPGQRTTVHARAEAALAKRAAPITQRAHHIARAADPNRPDHVTTLITAARERLHTAPAIAADHLQAAVSLMHADADHWHEAQVLLARARLLEGKILESRALLHALQPDSTSQPPLDPSAVVDAGKVERQLGRSAEAAAIARSGLAALPDDDTAVAAALHSELADAALDQQDYRLARQHADTAAIIARRHHDSTGEANALAQASLAHLFTADQATAQASATRAAELIDAATDSTVLTNLEAIYQVGLTEANLVRLTDAQRHLTRGAELSRRTGQRYILPPTLKALADVQLRSGDLRGALATLDEADHHAGRGGSPGTRAVILLLRALALLWQADPRDVGDVRELAEQAVDAVSDHTAAWAVDVRCLHAEIVLLTGDPARSRWILLDAAGGPELPRLTTWRKPRWCDMLTHLALLDGDRQSAKQSAALAEQCVEQLPSAGRRGFALRARMRAHALLGDTEQALDRAHQAIDDFSTCGKRIDTCRTLLAVATLSLDAGRTHQVDGWLSRAAYLADVCGSARLTTEIASQRRRLAAHSGQARTSGALTRLSTRERQIADLASTGMTSREIAATLFLSVRTVDSHLGRIYRKLGVPNRAGLIRTVLGSPAPADTAPHSSGNSHTADNAIDGR
ncbi:LuxR C-terminal-related transcriptional regulator [Streptomyces sp. NPDC001177]